MKKDRLIALEIKHSLQQGIEYLKAGVLQKFCKSQATKKGPPFGEPF